MKLRHLELAKTMKNLQKAQQLMNDNVSDFEDYDMMQDINNTLKEVLMCCEDKLTEIAGIQAVPFSIPREEHCTKALDYGVFGGAGRGKSFQAGQDAGTIFLDNLNNTKAFKDGFDMWYTQDMKPRS